MKLFFHFAGQAFLFRVVCLPTNVLGMVQVALDAYT